MIECVVWPVTGSVLIRFNPDLTSASYLLRTLDQVRYAPALSDDGSSSAKSAGFGLATTSLALAVAGEIAAPFLLPASAVLLVGTNLHTFRAAGRQLLRGAVRAAGTVHEHHSGNPGERSVHRIGRHELDAHLL